MHIRIYLYSMHTNGISVHQESACNSLRSALLSELRCVCTLMFVSVNKNTPQALGSARGLIFTFMSITITIDYNLLLIVILLYITISILI